MLTRRGWTVGIGSLISAGAGRLFGIGEFWVLALAGLTLTVTAVIWTRTRRVRLRIRRSVRPVRVQAGSAARVDLAVVNLGAATPVLQLTDPVSGTLGARLALGPLLAGEQVNASYLLPTDRRGKLVIGPAEAAVADPLGLARSAIGTGAPTSLVVHPATWALAPPRLTRGPEPLGASAEAHARQRMGEDFYALRDYTAGDDVRRIHWPSTARLGRPMVREDEVPRRSRVSVVLDTRSYAFDTERFEVAVSAAASVVLASASRHDPLRLLTVAGADIGFASSGEGITAIFDHLAEVSPSADGSLRATLAAATAAATGAVVVVLGAAERDAADDAETISAVGARAAGLTVIRVRSRGEPLREGGPGFIDIADPADLPRKWVAAQARTRTPAANPTHSPASRPTGTGNTAGRLG